MKLKFVPQHDQMDCGPACIAMVASYFGKQIPLHFLKENTNLSREGVSLLSISELFENIGFETYPAKLTLKTLDENGSLPCILHWNKNHFVVLLDVKKSFFTGKNRYKIADPSHGIIWLSEKDFLNSWLSDGEEGIALFISPTNSFYQQSFPEENKVNLSFAVKYFKEHKTKFIFLSLMLLLGSCLSLIFPFLTQTLIDKGVNTKDINLITTILLSQVALYVGSITIEIFRNWLMIHIGTRISISIISDFLKKMLVLPMSFFDSKMKGDFTQRIQDNERIEDFLTSQSLMTFFSMITFLVFFGVLWYYNVSIVLIYSALTALSLGWAQYWLKKREILDYYRFREKGESQESVYEILNGVSEMKLNQFEDYKRKEWEGIQNKLFKTTLRIMKVDQFQFSGFEFLNQLKNILVTFFAALQVVKGNMTIGELLAISYIIGQLNSPVNQMISFFRSLQDAKLSLSRLNEVQNHEEEEKEGMKDLEVSNKALAPEERGITLNNVSFQYEGPKSQFVLKDVDLFIPEGKVTAIVGASGSGKTTLMKLLLKFYNPTHGTIHYNEDDILTLSPKSIRENYGVVMQDGFIFSDTIERNIATSEVEINTRKMENAVRVANISSFIDNLPLGYSTKIGAAGNGISGGQKQRVLIARAVYKNPHFILFDEATSALDAENEKIIHDNLQEFFKGKTVIIVAHRLSTVKNADQIIVLKNGAVVEKGNHQELVNKKADYYSLVKNQLELGN
ncbi:peptidase domain-containing ABC transporter [Chryseobacterium sp. Tr-659]|uniref:peptidase domain-containing ABC transporter n=1 Tax=Chryseobacterium sp. Tr-659 TaxID=2608340 RepID=UPI00141DA0FA|nr:peptidase domain-containing ABC transporter [Chryseobacterium sp. Tr-659]NIF05871.1 peptidase domain-containing ABC transporter [Chryseobacterium sp. Tr-659]